MVLRRLPAETAHRAGFALIRVAGATGAAGLLGRWLGPRDPVLRVRALGLEFPGPLGLAAGSPPGITGPFQPCGSPRKNWAASAPQAVASASGSGT